MRGGSVMAAALALIALVTGGLGCTQRYSFTRVFLHGEAFDTSTGRPVPYAVVRRGEQETLADEKGHYRFLFLERCLKLGAGPQSASDNELLVFARGFEPVVVGYHLDRIELIGGSSCPKDTDKFLRLGMTPVRPGI